MASQGYGDGVSYGIYSVFSKTYRSVSFDGIEMLMMFMGSPPSSKYFRH